MSKVENTLFNFWGAVYELMRPELVDWVLDELNEGNEQAPRMRSVHNQTLEQHSSDLLLDCLRVGLGKQIQQGAAEVMRVAVRIPQLVGNRIQEQVPT
jgi:hypothetical protein